MRRFHSGTLALAVALTVCAVVRSAPPSAPALFRAIVTGEVKSAKPDGLSFMLTVAKADGDAVNNTGIEPTELVGKTVTLGVRMPVKDGKPQPHPDDVAYIKSLKAGMSIRVKIFAVRGNIKSLRMQGPGEPAKDGSQ
jgi:hypothetical protein